MKKNVLGHLLVIVLSFYCCIPFTVNAEGSKQLMADMTCRAALSTNNNGITNNFAAYNSNLTGREKDRLYIHIANPSTEVVYFGFSDPYSAGSSGSSVLGVGDATATYLRVWDPNGNIVFGPININSPNILSDVAGFNQVKAGPVPLAGASGYSPITFTPAPGAPSGDYYIEFNRNDPINYSGSQVDIDFWDITVADITGAPLAKDGRVWTYGWGFYSKDIPVGSPYTGIFKGILYSYTNEGIVNEVNFQNSNFKGGSYRLGFNETGPGTSGNLLLDRMSIKNGRVVNKGHKVFVHDPDPVIYPSGSIQTPSFQYTLLSCNATEVHIQYTTTHAGVLNLFLDFNGNGIYDEATTDRILLQYASSGTNVITWDLKDGQGNTISPPATIPVRVEYGIGIHHLSLADVEYLNNGYTIQTYRPFTPTPYITKLFYDDLNIRTGASPDITVPFVTGPQPPTTELNGCTTPCHNWDNFVFDNTGYGNRNTINTWWYSYLETLNFTLDLLPCTLLSLKFSDFYSRVENCQVTLEWTAAQETGTNYYTIEKSSDGATFEEIGRVKRVITTTPVNKYYYKDISGSKESKICWYRLKENTIDGQVVVLKTIAVKNACYGTDNKSFLIYPNPIVDGVVSISFTSYINTSGTLRFNDLSGRTQFTRKIITKKGENKFITNVESLPRGVYIIEMQTATDSKIVGKFIK